MYDGELETKVQSVLLLVEAAAYLFLSVWCLTRMRAGQWALLGALGAGLVGIAFGVGAVATFQVLFLDSTWVFDHVFFHAHIQTAFTVGRVAGSLLLVAGFVVGRRTPPAATSPGYGPG